MASLGEETRASCRGPSNHNAIALILPHKAMLGLNGGAIGADVYRERPHRHSRAHASRLRAHFQMLLKIRAKDTTTHAIHIPQCRGLRF